MPPRPSPAKTLLSALLALAVAGCNSNIRQQPTAQQLEEGAAAAHADYVIGAMDLLQISVWREEQLSLNQVEVRLDGKISAPLVDDIQAAGLTTTQLKEGITERLKEYVTAPQVTVIVLRVGSKNVFVLGEV